MTPEMAFTTVDFPWATCPIVPVPPSGLAMGLPATFRFNQLPKLIVAYSGTSSQLSSQS